MTIQLGEPLVEDGVVERPFEVVRDGSVAPGILWSPERVDRAAPLVLMGHGGSGHKRTERQVRMARWFASTAGIASAAIDGPYHGDRVPEPLDSREYQQRLAASGVDVITDRMVDDWCATVDGRRCFTCSGMTSFSTAPASSSCSTYSVLRTSS